MSRDPRALIEGTGVPAALVDFRWEPYQSLQPRFASARRLEALCEGLSQRVVRFEPGSARIPDAQMNTVDDLAGMLKSLFAEAANAHRAVRVEVLARTDSQGSNVSNIRLAQNRGEAVHSMLATLGIEPSRLIVRDIGAAEPLQSGVDVSNQQFNRSVLLRASIGPH